MSATKHFIAGLLLRLVGPQGLTLIILSATALYWQTDVLPGPDWHIVAVSIVSIAGTLAVALFSLCYKIIIGIARDSKDRAEKLEISFETRLLEISIPIKERLAALELKHEAEINERNRQHRNNCEFMVQLAWAFKSGDMSKLDPSALFKD